MSEKSGLEHNKNYERVISSVKKWASSKSYKVVIDELDLGQAYPNGCIFIASENPNACSIELLYYFDHTDPEGNKEQYPVTIAFYGGDGPAAYSAFTQNHYVEEALLKANIIRKYCDENTFLQMLPLLLDALAQGDVKQYFWWPQWMGWNPHGLCSLTRFRIKDKYFYMKRGSFYQEYKPKYFRRRPIRIVSYEAWRNISVPPDKQYQENEYIADIELLGGASFFYGLVISISLLFLLYGINFDSGIYVINLYLLSTIIIFVGLFIMGIIINSKWRRYILLFFLPISIIGLVTVPFGTWIYSKILWVLWQHKHVFFPFDTIISKKKGSGVDSKV
ncbi:MAG: hypothetical protein H3C30_14450 [Candidatus Hydrogenedentes bacterium]|nr:hypothetical protein [Candidatus Hydrogenedentota bacterium]